MSIASDRSLPFFAYGTFRTAEIAFPRLAQLVDWAAAYGPWYPVSPIPGR